MLKVGDRVKLNSSHSEHSDLIKGSLGTVVGISIDRIKIKFDDDWHEYVCCYPFRVESVLKDGNQLLLFEVD